MTPARKHGGALVAEYRWLIEALQGQCDVVRHDLSDYDRTLGVAALWNVPGSKVPHGHAIKCHEVRYVGGVWVGGHREGGELQVYSLNAEIEAGRVTREQVIAQIVSKRPKVAA